MKTTILRILCLYCLIAGLCLEVPPVRAEIIDKIVAICNDELILLSEIQEYEEDPTVRFIANLAASSNLEQDTLQYMVEQRLLQREIQYLATPKDREPVLQVAKQYLINTYYANNSQEFQQRFEARGISEAELENELELYMKGADYIRRKFRFNADVDNPDVVLELFQTWMTDLKMKAKVQSLF